MAPLISALGGAAIAAIALVLLTCTSTASAGPAPVEAPPSIRLLGQPVAVAPDGAVWVIEDSGKGRLLRLSR